MSANALSITTVSPLPISTGEAEINFTIPIAFSDMFSVQKGGLVSGNNTITPPNHPDTTSIVICVPDPAQAGVITVVLKGGNSDTGVTLSNLYPTIMPSAGAFILNVSGASTYPTYQIYFM